MNNELSTGQDFIYMIY